MSGPQELHISFRHLGADYDINLVKGEKSDHSVKINGVTYAVLCDKEKLDTACEILKSVSLDSISNVEDLNGRLSVLKDISFPTQKTDDIGIKTLKTTSLAPVLKLPSRNIEIAKLIRMVRNISSDADVQALCRECLDQNNNNTKLALDSLRSAFYQAGAGKVSVKITDMLMKEASDKNVDEIRAFGQKRTVDVIQFLKALPQTGNGAIDLTKMKSIGHGGHQDVFALKDGSPFVIKVNRDSFKMNNNERLEKYKTDNEAYQALRDSFGDHCTVEQLLLRDVTDDSGTKKAIISVADFEVGFKKESKLGLQATDFEWNDATIAQNLDAYDSMLKSVLFPEDTPSFDLSTLETKNPKIAKIVNLIQDPAFKDALKEFLTKFKEYFNKTGQYLDIAGRDNIIFFKDNKGWTFKLGTVIKGETAKKFENALNWLHNGSKETEESGDHMWMLRYCFHWTKTLNTLAMMVGMDRVIIDANIVTMWSDLERAEITGKPSNPQRFLEILKAVENYHADKLLEGFKALGVDPEKEVDCLLSILSESPPNKKMVLAQYLHQVLPRVPSDTKENDPEAYKFCYVRHHIAGDIRKIPEGKALAIECFREVLKDPQGPREEVLKAINELKKELDVKSAKEAYLLATKNPHDSHVAVGILRPDGSISELNLGKNESYGAHRIGSVTKTFTTFLALKLINDGMINLETSLGDLIDKSLIDERVLQGVFADPEKARQMTLEQLLSHTSGLEYDDKPRIGPEGEDDPNVRVSTLNERFTYQATLGKKYEHKHEPGEGIGLYSNLGFDVAAWMLELVYNANKGDETPQIPFSQIIRDELFTKVFKLSEKTRIAPGFSGNGDVIQAGCGDMVSSISDLLKVAQVLQKGEKHLSSYFGEEWQKKMLGARGSDDTYTYGLGCEANASSIQFSGLNYELFDDGVGRDVTAHVAFPLHENQPAIVAMCDSNALGPEANQVKFRQELRKLAGLSVS